MAKILFTIAQIVPLQNIKEQVEAFRKKYDGRTVVTRNATLPKGDGHGKDRRLSAKEQKAMLATEKAALIKKAAVNLDKMVISTEKYGSRHVDMVINGVLEVNTKSGRTGEHIVSDMANRLKFQGGYGGSYDVKAISGLETSTYTDKQIDEAFIGLVEEMKVLDKDNKESELMILEAVPVEAVNTPPVIETKTDKKDDETPKTTDKVDKGDKTAEKSEENKPEVETEKPGEEPKEDDSKDENKEEGEQNV